MTSQFPTIWKTSRIVPLYKGKGCKEESQKYRPVSQLNPVSKELEICFLKQITEHMERNNLWHRNQHAYRPGHNTTTALIQLLTTCQNNTETGHLSATITMDLSAAFDCVDRRILLAKLKKYRIRDAACTWVSSYLMDRSYCQARYI